MMSAAIAPDPARDGDVFARLPIPLRSGALRQTCADLCARLCSDHCGSDYGCNVLTVRRCPQKKNKTLVRVSLLVIALAYVTP